MSVPAALALVGGVGAGTLVPPSYRASTLIRAQWGGQVGPVSPRMAADLDARRLQATRQEALNRSSAALALRDDRAHAPDGQRVAPLRERVDALLESASVEARGGGVFAITCVDRDPRQAALACDRLATLLVERTDRERSREELSSPAALGRRMAEAQAVILEKEAALERLRGGAPAEGRDGAAAPRDQPAARPLTAELARARARAAEVRRAIVAETRPSPSATPDPSPELTRYRAELAELRKRYTEEHPDVQALNRRILRAEAALPPPVVAEPPQSPLTTELNRIEQEIANLEREAQKDAARPAPGGGSAAARGAAAEEIERATRECAAAREAYLKLDAEWRRADTDFRLGRGQTARFEMVRTSQVPARPYFPDRRLFGVAGFVVGLTLGLLAAIAAEVRDPSIKGPEDLAEILPQPLLAEISLVRGRRDRGDV